MFDDLLAPAHIVLIIVVALLVFGPKRLPEIGAGLGKTVREFKAALSNPHTDDATPTIEVVQHTIGDKPPSAP